jgi:PTH1 family peptidyl-tRNA hydrolase
MPTVDTLIVGLGNPGPEYARTRHNVGRLVVDRLAEEAAAPMWKVRTKLGAEVTRTGGWLLAKPTVYMNASGRPVRALLDFFKVPVTRLLLISDDIDLPLGELRYRRSGSSGGHNGLADVIRELGSEAVPRLRVGIGSPDRLPGAGRDATGFVLGRFTKEETAELPDIITAAAAAAKKALS